MAIEILAKLLIDFNVLQAHFHWECRLLQVLQPQLLQGQLISTLLCSEVALAQGASDFLSEFVISLPLRLLATQGKPKRFYLRLSFGKLSLNSIDVISIVVLRWPRTIAVLRHSCRLALLDHCLLLLDQGFQIAYLQALLLNFGLEPANLFLLGFDELICELFSAFLAVCHL